MKLSYLHKLAITVYYELCLVDRTMHTQYIEMYFLPESAFWDVIKSIDIDLPANLQLQQ